MTHRAACLVTPHPYMRALTDYQRVTTPPLVALQPPVLGQAPARSAEHADQQWPRFVGVWRREGRRWQTRGDRGRQGGAVAGHLLSDGRRVLAVTGKPDGEPARRLAVLGAAVPGVDMTNRATFACTLRGT
jgi:hypothetical protein